jgi:hypothetical protein
MFGGGTLQSSSREGVEPELPAPYRGEIHGKQLKKKDEMTFSRYEPPITSGHNGRHGPSDRAAELNTIKASSSHRKESMGSQKAGSGDLVSVLTSPPLKGVLSSSKSAVGDLKLGSAHQGADTDYNGSSNHGSSKFFPSFFQKSSSKRERERSSSKGEASFVAGSNSAFFSAGLKRSSTILSNGSTLRRKVAKKKERPKSNSTMATTASGTQEPGEVSLVLRKCIRLIEQIGKFIFRNKGKL